MFKDKNGNFSMGKAIGTIAVLVALIIVLASSVIVIPAGHTGVKVTLGRVSENVLQEGLHFKIPFVQTVVKVDNRIVKLEVETEAFSRDLQTITTIVAVNYRISKDMSYSIYKEVGNNFEDVLITPAVNEVLKAVTAQYTASELVSSRSEVSVMLNDLLREKLEARGIYIEDLNIINWEFSEEYIAAIEAKQVAEQNLIRTQTEQEERIVIAEAAAQMQIIEANAAAEAAIIAANAAAEVELIAANAQAEANEIVAASLTPEVLDYLALQIWNGQLPQVTGGATPFVSIE